MTNTQIPREAVDAAARALGNHIELDFDVLPADEQLQAREAATAALNAAAPHLEAAALDRLIRDPKNFTPGGEFRATVLVNRINELKSGVDEPAKPRKWATINCLRWPVYVGSKIVGGGDNLELARSVAQQQSAERPDDFVTVDDPEGRIVVGYLNGAQLGEPVEPQPESLGRIARVWSVGDPEPDDCTEVCDRHGNVWVRRFLGWLMGDDDPTDPVMWGLLVLRSGPVTEVLATEAGV